MNEVEHVLSLGNLLGEGPLWHPGEGALYWVDIESGQIFRYDSRTGQHEKVQMDIAVGALAFRQAGGLILATAKGYAYWDMQDRAWNSSPTRKRTNQSRASMTARWIAAGGFGLAP